MTLLGRGRVGRTGRSDIGEAVDTASLQTGSAGSASLLGQGRGGEREELLVDDALEVVMAAAVES
jgi:hypothetical protein